MYSIYRILNTKTDLSYVGMTSDIKRRWHSHRTDLRSGEHHSYKLQKAYDECGEEAFEYHILEENILRENVYNREGFWIHKYDSFKTGYNVRYVAYNENGEIAFVETPVYDPSQLENLKRELKSQMSEMFNLQLQEMKRSLIEAEVGYKMFKEMYKEVVSESEDYKSALHYIVESLCRHLDKHSIEMPDLPNLDDKYRAKFQNIHQRTFNAGVNL